MKKYIFTMFVLGATVLLGWCMKVNMSQTINQNWETRVAITYDSTATRQAWEQLEADWFSDTSEKPCSPESDQELKILLKDYKCTIIDEYRYTVEGTII